LLKKKKRKIQVCEFALTTIHTHPLSNSPYSSALSRLMEAIVLCDYFWVSGLTLVLVGKNSLSKRWIKSSFLPSPLTPALPFLEVVLRCVDVEDMQQMVSYPPD